MAMVRKEAKRSQRKGGQAAGKKRRSTEEQALQRRMLILNSLKSKREKERVHPIDPIEMQN